MKYSEYKYLVLSDLYRLSADIRFPTLIRYLLKGGSFKYLFWMRTSRFTRSKLLLKYTIYPVAIFFLNHYRFKFGIEIPHQTTIGSGLYIGHFGGIIIHANSTIGKNCNLSQGVTLGQANRGKNKGHPTLGDNVYVGPGAKIVGDVTVGNDVAIGANCVVTKDIPDNSVVVGIPGQVISQDGSTGYVNRIDYEDKIRDVNRESTKEPQSHSTIDDIEYA